MSNNTSISDRHLALISEARRLLEHHKFEASSSLCRTFVEGLLRDSLRDHIWDISNEQRWLVFEIEKELGSEEGKEVVKGINDFDLAHLLGLYEKAGLWKAFEKMEGRLPGAAKRLDLNFLRKIGNSAIHGRLVDPRDARDALNTAEMLFSFFGFFEAKNDVDIFLQDGRFSSSAKFVEGIEHGNRFLEAIVEDPLLDRFDTSFVGSRALIEASQSGYWQSLRDRTAKGEVRVRRVVTVGGEGEEKAAWMLLKLVPEQEAHLATSALRLAAFRVSHLDGRADMSIPGISVAYSTSNPSYGYALVNYIGGDDDQQRFIFFQGQEVLSAFRHAYAHWFRSADVIDSYSANRLFAELFPKATSQDALRDLIISYASTLQLDENDQQLAMQYWCRHLQLS